MSMQDAGLQSEHYQMVNTPPAQSEQGGSTGGGGTGDANGPHTGGGGGKRPTTLLAHPSAPLSEQQTSDSRQHRLSITHHQLQHQESAATATLPVLPVEFTQPAGLPNAMPHPSPTASVVAIAGKDGSIPCTSYNAALLCTTVAEVGALTRLGMMYRFTAAFEGIPAYQAISKLSMGSLLGMRPGSISIEGLLLPFAGLRRRKRSPKNRTEV